MQGLRSTSALMWAPEKVGVRWQLLILSPLMGTPRERRGYTAIPPSFGPPMLLPIPMPLPLPQHLPLQVCVGNKGHAVGPSARLSGIKGRAPGRLWDRGAVKGLAPPSRAGPGPGATRARGPSLCGIK